MLSFKEFKNQIKMIIENIMKRKIYCIWFLTLGFIINSCDKSLEEELVTDVSAASYYTTEKGFLRNGHL